MQQIYQINGSLEDISAMLVSAERYAIGRQTYIVNWTCTFIKNNLHLLTEKDVNVMIKDIESASDYGADFDKKDWMNLLDALKMNTKKKDSNEELAIKQQETEKVKDCDTCKYFYGLVDYGDIHTLCHKKVCYMCMNDGKNCDLYDEGDVPEGETRGV